MKVRISLFAYLKETLGMGLKRK